MTPSPVFFMQDGAVDELICIPFVHSMPACELVAVWTTPADCLGPPTAGAVQRMLAFCGVASGSLPIFLSDSSSPRPFPWSYRQYSMMVNLLPALNTPATRAAVGDAGVARISTRGSRPAVEPPQTAWLDAIRQRTDTAGAGLTFLCTGPLTDLAWLLEVFPGLAAEISRVVWMGGSILGVTGAVGGNIDPGIAPGANPNAEWNAYWDPAAVQAVWSTGLPFHLFPLNVTNQVFLTPEVIREHLQPATATSTMVDLAVQMYAMVAFQDGYSFWDTVTAAFLGKPDLFTFARQPLQIVTDEASPDLGNITVAASGGYPVEVAASIKVDDFYTYLVQRLSSVG